MSAHTENEVITVCHEGIWGAQESTPVILNFVTRW